jgi:hypothetical protein
MLRPRRKPVAFAGAPPRTTSRERARTPAGAIVVQETAVRAAPGSGGIHIAAPTSRHAGSKRPWQATAVRDAPRA